MRLIFLLLLTISMKAQIDEGVSTYEFSKFKRETDYRFENIELNLQKHSKVYHNGLTAALIGVALNSISIPLLYNGNGAGITLAGVGTALTIGGTITMWSSHKYIGRAGRR
jgi:hypothetical protein